MHVVEFFLQFSFAIDVKRVALGLPESVAGAEVGKVMGSMLLVPLANGKTAYPLPAM